MSCEHECEKPPEFPARVENRPGLPSLRYRIGTYPTLRAHLFSLLDKEPALQAWTHRGADDPGIALLEGAALVGDILTFYQELYANEAFLRTAKWKESIADLVRLTGYRLAPGLGGNALFAVAVKAAVTVPKGFRFKAQLDGAAKQDDFESAHAVKAHPHTGRFRLYRQPLPPIKIGTGPVLNQLELRAVGGSSAFADIARAKIKAGDKLLLVPDSRMYDVTGAAYEPQGKIEQVTVDKVETLLDRTILTFKADLGIAREAKSMRAFRIDRSFKHFGAGAPPTTTTVDDRTKEVKQFDTGYTREIWGTHRPAEPAKLYPRLPAADMPLEGKVENLALGGRLICTGFTQFDGVAGPERFAVVKTIRSIRPDTLSWGSLSGPVTMVEIDGKLVANDSILNEKADIRRMLFYEATSPELTLAAPRAFADGAFGVPRLRFFGSRSELKAFQGRKLLMEHEDGRRRQATVTSLEPLSALLPFADEPRLWTLKLDAKPDFGQEDFDERDNKVWVYGNLIEATQGKSEGDQVLGDGDHRVPFQTFALPKSPLTYLLDPGRTPAESPELEIFVDGIRWRQVDTFFSSGPKGQVYIVRQDESGKSFVQFGDGKTGARLPSGKGNVAAAFRTGNGAHGPLKAGTTPQAGEKLAGLDKVYLPLPVTGGAAPETSDNARAAAPGKLQSLGRMVSLSDYEAEALALPGVLKARAHWGLHDGSPLLRLIVLTESEDPADLEAVEKALHGFNRCRGPARFPLRVLQGRRRHVYLQVTVGPAPARREADVKRAVQAALGLGGAEGDGVDGSAGLFGADRRFGQTAHSSQVLAAVQNAAGVDWARLTAAVVIPEPVQPVPDPADLVLPRPVLHDNLNCGAEEVLALHAAHLILSVSKPASAGECA